MKIPVEKTIKIGDYYFNANELVEKALLTRVKPLSEDDIEFEQPVEEVDESE